MKKVLINLVILFGVLGGLYLTFSQPIGHLLLRNNEITLSKKQIDKNKQKSEKTDFDWSKSRSLSTTDIIKAKITTPNYIGLISIPNLKIMLPISPGTSNNSLSMGAGTLYADQKMGEGNYALASHFVQGENNKKLLFSPIYYHGSVGQKIYVTDLNYVYEYETTVVKVIKATDVSVTYNVPGKKLITLLTCDYTAERGRVMMQGYLKKKIDWKNTEKNIQNQFTNKSKILS